MVKSPMQPYYNPEDEVPLTVSIFGAVFSSILQIAPILLISRIVANANVEPYRPDTFILGICFGFINGAYCLYSSQTVGAISTGIGLFLTITFLLIYGIYSKARVKLLKTFALFFVPCCFISIIGPSLIVSLPYAGNKREFILRWLGVAATVVGTIGNFGQLTNVVQIVKAKNTDSIAIEISLCIVPATSCWLVYAVLIGDIFIFIGNILGIVSGLIQLSLKFWFRNTSGPAFPQPAADTAIYSSKF